MGMRSKKMSNYTTTLVKNVFITPMAALVILFLNVLPNNL
jgi:hypothetical protein